MEFDGDVLIQASVRNGACIKATGNIVIDGAVEAATIESTGGDVDLRHGVAGHDRAVIRAAGDITSRFAEKVTMYAGRDIAIRLGSLHSHLIASRAIRVIQSRGQVIGGSAVASDLVQAKQIGSSSGVLTEVFVGLTPAVMEQLGQIDTDLSAERRRCEQASELADRIERAIGDPAQLAPHELKTYTALRKCQFIAEQNIKSLEEQRQQVVGDGSEHHTGRIEVLNQLMSQVVVYIGNAVFKNDDCRKECRIVYDEETAKVVVRHLR